MVARVRSQGSDGERFPSEDTLRLVQRSLRDYLAGESDDERVCESFTELAEEADARQLRAEGVLVAFKQIWSDMPEVQSLPDRGDRERILARLVRLCINAYYAR